MSSKILDVKTHVLPGQYVREYPAAMAEDQEDTLQLSIKQYTPRDDTSSQPGAITVIAAHANALSKELYEPMWEELYQRLKSLGIPVRSIWIADQTNQGVSSVLNEGKLGNDPSWLDHSRDLLHMINHFRKEMPRPLVGIGHSMGGSQLVNLSIMHPRLLSSLVLIDPIMRLEDFGSNDPDKYSFAQMSTFRRDIWPSRAAATVSFKKNIFYQSWDDRVMDRWLEFGLRDLPTQIYPESPYGNSTETPVTLTTSKHQEVFSFLRPNFENLDADGKPIVNRQTHPDISGPVTDPFYRPECSSILRTLPSLRPGVFYIFGSRSEISLPHLRQEKVETTGTGIGGSGGAKEGRVKEVLLDDVGHLIPMEAVNECAQAAAEWLAPEIQKWRAEEAEFQRAWSQKGRMAKVMISEEWKNRIGGDPRVKPPKL